MRNQKLYLSLALMAMACGFLFSAWGNASDERRILDERIGLYHFSQRSTLSGHLSLLSSATKSPCGVALRRETDDVLPESAKKKTIYDATLERFLDALVAEVPGYRWFIDDGVINVVPEEYFDESSRYRALLDKKIARIDLEDIPVEDAGTELCQLARNKCYTRWLQGVLSRLMYGAAAKASTSPSEVTSLHASNLSFREALNALVRKPGGGCWEFTPGDKWFAPSFTRVEFWGKPAAPNGSIQDNRRGGTQ
jgi:hypothetical protein